jgi:nucleoside kinase
MQHPLQRYDVTVVGSAGTFDYILPVPELPTKASPLVSTPMSPRGVQERYFGGCAFNIAVAAAAVGARTGVVSPVGNDFERAGYREHLRCLGVDVSGIVRLRNTPSSCAFLIHDKQHIQYCIGYTYSDSLLRNLSVIRPIRMIRRARWCVVAPNPVAFVVHLARVAHASGIPIALVGPTFSGRYMAANRALLAWASVIILNSIEFQMLCNASDKKTGGAFSLGSGAIFITEGAAGSKVLDRDGEHFVESAPARKLVDPSGAGDAYAGGVVAALARGWPHVQAARLGSVIASFIVEAVGCQTGLPSRVAIKRRYAEAYRRRIAMEGMT